MALVHFDDVHHERLGYLVRVLCLVEQGPQVVVGGLHKLLLHQLLVELGHFL
jgi:hypothetical protein